MHIVLQLFVDGLEAQLELIVFHTKYSYIFVENENQH